jgi:hypothetical protein
MVCPIRPFVGTKDNDFQDFLFPFKTYASKLLAMTIPPVGHILRRVGGHWSSTRVRCPSVSLIPQYVPGRTKSYQRIAS